MPQLDAGVLLPLNRYGSSPRAIAPGSITVKKFVARSLGGNRSEVIMRLEINDTVVSDQSFHYDDVKFLTKVHLPYSSVHQRELNLNDIKVTVTQADAVEPVTLNFSVQVPEGKVGGAGFFTILEQLINNVPAKSSGED